MAATLSFQQAATNGSGGSSPLAFTCASAAGQERLVALCGIGSSPITSSGFTSVTIDGQAATQVGSTVRTLDPGNNGPIVAFFRAAGTSGTSINVAYTKVGTFFDVRGALWTLSDAGTLLDTATASLPNPRDNGTPSPSLDIDTVAGGAVAALVFSYSGGMATTWTGLTERYDGAVDTLYSGDWFTVADLNAGSAATPLTVTATQAASFSANSAISGLAVSFNAAATGVTLSADAGSYAITGSAAAFVASSSLVADAGAYALTGSDVTFQTSGNVTFFCASGEYMLSGSAVTFPGAELPPEPAPSPGGGYSGAVYRPYRFGKKRKREDEEPPEPVYPPDLPAPPRSPSPPDLPAPPLHTLIDLAPPAPRPPPRQIKAKPTVADDDEDDDGEAIALLLKLLS